MRSRQEEAKAPQSKAAGWDKDSAHELDSQRELRGKREGNKPEGTYPDGFLLSLGRLVLDDLLCLLGLDLGLLLGGGRLSPDLGRLALGRRLELGGLGVELFSDVLRLGLAAGTVGGGRREEREG